MVRMEEQQIDIQKFRADMMRVMKMGSRKPVQPRILAVKHGLIDYNRTKSLASMVRTWENWKPAHRKIEVDASVAGIMPSDTRRDI